MEESCDVQVLPTLLTSRRVVREAEVTKPQAHKRTLRRHTTDTSEVAVAHAISVKNTFVDYGSQRSPSLEPFYRERKASSCPSSPVVKYDAASEEGTSTYSVQVGRACSDKDERKGLPETCSNMCLPFQQMVPDAPTRCPSRDSPADWQNGELSPSEAGTTMAQFTPVLQASMYTPVCRYSTSHGGDAFCLAGSSLTIPILQPPVTPVARPPMTPMVSRAQVKTNNHTILSLADAIGEPAPPRLPMELSKLIPGASAGPLGSPRVPMPPAPPAEPPRMSSGGSTRGAAMRKATPPTAPSAPPPLSPALGSVELPSLGSAGHSSGDCKPCAFFHTAGCSNGISCQFCHICDANEKKRRRKEKILSKRMAGKAKQAADTVELTE
eukprot:CAMPEP_0115289254 /NCGR_PEP_ID=MMETSP0270-20121206/63409_1 /TAXON_ID=71861 /ORGANISM="Scrippsiella trochoidea, Strain CCMP3099" /LENGTH=381 /DNA_ID=CAMNT_0002706417 /DNA_START=94 /DNA_END=1239 /DNA_ORIENTATION=+